MIVCCGAAASFPQGPALSLFLGSRSENWLGGRTWTRDLDLFTGVAALGLSVILEHTLIHCPSIEPPGGRVVLTTCPALWVRSSGRRQSSSWPLAPDHSVRPCKLCCNPWAVGAGSGGVVHLLHHEAWRAWPVLCGNFALLGGRAVCDHLFPWFLGSPAGSAVGPATTRGGELPCLLGWRAPVREGSSPVCSLGGGGGRAPALYRVGRWAAAAGSKFRDVWVVLVSLAFMSGMQVFPGRPPMPAGQVCLSGKFSVFEVQPVL